MQKVQMIMKETIPQINAAFFDAQIPKDMPFISSIPKIAKGESYRQLPYVMMDYPASFGKEAIFACRTFFWWGNFFSIQFLYSGKYKARFQENIFRNLPQPDSGIHLCVHHTEWEHHFERDNFLPYEDAIATGIDFRKKHFLKTGMRFNLSEWNNMPEKLTDGYRKLVRLMED